MDLTSQITITSVASSEVSNRDTCIHNFSVEKQKQTAKFRCFPTVKFGGLEPRSSDLQALAIPPILG